MKQDVRCQISDFLVLVKIMYEKYYLEIVSAIQKKTLIGADIMLVWAAANQPELYAQERTLSAELNALWIKSEIRSPTGSGTKSEINKGEFEAFKAKVLAWGRIVLMIYKKFSETKT